MEVMLGRQHAKQNMCQYVQYLDTGRTTSFEEKFTEFVARWGHNMRWLVERPVARSHARVGSSWSFSQP
jgi:hypothetical protein